MYFVHKQVHILRKKIDELQQSHDEEVSAVLEAFHQLKRQVHQYHQGLEAAMGLVDLTGALSAIKINQTTEKLL